VFNYAGLIYCAAAAPVYLCYKYNTVSFRLGAVYLLEA